MSDVAIVGIGMHAFGRHPITGREQGAIAARRALEDAGIAVVRRRVRVRRLLGRRRGRHAGQRPRPHRRAVHQRRPTAAPPAAAR